MFTGSRSVCATHAHAHAPDSINLAQTASEEESELAEVSIKRIAVAPQRREFEKYEEKRLEFLGKLRDLAIKVVHVQRNKKT